MSESELPPLKARSRPERMGISENTEAVYKSLNPIFKAWMNFKSGNYEECGRICDERVSSEDIGHPLWQIKVAALTEDARIIDEDLGESTMSEEIFGEQVMQKTARPGTSLKTAKKAEKTGYNPNSASVRPQTGAGPMTGYARPGTSTRPGTGKLTTAEGLKTARVATAALRPMTNLGRSIQTAALDPIDGPFIKTSRLNIPEIAKDPSNAKFLFDYITTVLADYRTALSLAEAAALEDPSENYWSYAQSISYLRLGMSRKAEEHAKAYASKTIDPAGAILLSAVYKKLDQPTAACEALKTGLERCPTSLDIMATQARLEQARQNHERGDEIYSDILKHDPVNQEALCVLAASSFYKDDIIKSFSLYSKALQIGPACASLYNNLALASVSIGQVDLGFRSFSKALDEATNDEDFELVWYNIGTAAVSIGDFPLAERAYKISSVYGNGGYSLNNLSVLASLADNKSEASNLLAQSNDIDSTWETQWNSALLAQERGDLQTAYLKSTLSAELNQEEKRNADFLREIRAKFHLI